MLPLLTLLACGLRVDPAPPPTAPIFEVVSPSPGAALRVPWVPLLVRISEPFVDSEVELRIDGVPVELSLGINRKRVNRLGGGYDHLALLDLSALEPGPHALDLRFTSPEGRRVQQQQTFTWDRPPHRVRFEVSDPDGAPLDARVVVLRDGAPMRLVGPDAAAADPRYRDTQLHSAFAVGGATELWLDPGDYTFIATAGLRRGAQPQALRVDDDATLRFTLAEEVPTPGWLSADLHMHTGRSGDAFISDVQRLNSLLTAGLDLAVITDHDKVGDLERPLAALAREGLGLRTLAGVEASIEQRNPDALEGRRSFGHLNAFPVTGEDAAPLPDPLAGSPAGLIDAWRARHEAAPYPGADSVLLQLNHPRGIHFRPEQTVRGGAHALFRALGYKPKLPLSAEENARLMAAEPVTGTTALSWDAMELFNRFSLKLYRRVRRDWIALMNQGVFITATGNSDSHAAALELAGFPINLIACPPPAAGEALDLPCLIDAVREARVSLTTGPVVELELIDGEQRAGLGELLRAEDGEVTARLRVRAASWVPVHQLRLIANGEVVWQEDLDVPLEREGAGEWRREVTLSLEEDAWVFLEAGWPMEAPVPEAPVEALGVYAHVAPGYQPLGLTNPVRVDVGELGWEPPGLPEPGEDDEDDEDSGEDEDSR